MKLYKIILIAFLLVRGSYVVAQVGINTESPAATLDVVGNASDPLVSDGLIAPRMTREELTDKEASYATAQNGTMIYITDISGGDALNSRVNVTAKGYYYFNGTLWNPFISVPPINYTGSTSIILTGNSFERAALTGEITASANGNVMSITDGAVTASKIADGTITNDDLSSVGTGVGGIYKGNGTTPASAVVVSIPTSGTLAFTPSGTQVANQFSVDGTTLSVDALNDRVGIGTNAPSQKLEVAGSIHVNAEGSAIVNDVTQSRLGLVKKSGSLPFIASGNNQPIIFSELATLGEQNILPNIAGTFTERMRIHGGGNVGIGGITPANILHLGSSTNPLRYLQLSNSTTGNTSSDGTIFGINANGDATINNRESLPLLFSTTNTERMRIDASGNVGIGTNSPTSKLHVQGNLLVSNDLRVNGGVLDSNGDIGILGDVLSSNGTGTDWVSLTAATTTEWSREGNDSTDPALNFIGNTDAVDLRIRTNNLERLSITATGNVGIGTTAPNAPLQFVNTLTNRKIVLSETANNDHQIYGFGVNSNILRYQVDATTANHVFYAGTSASASNELMRIQGNGNVGIGASAPSQKLEVAGTVYVNGENSAISIDASNASRLGFVKKSGSVPFIAAGNNQPIIFSELATGGQQNILPNIAGAFTERMRIHGGGNVGIGGITPTTKLDINGNTIRLRTSRTPASAIDSCNQGDMAWDSNFIYVCVATNSWKRSALSTW